jgi:hypothetical protein
MMPVPAVPVPVLRLGCTRHAQQHAQTQSPHYNPLHILFSLFSRLLRPGTIPKNAQTLLHAASEPQKTRPSRRALSLRRKNFPDRA